MISGEDIVIPSEVGYYLFVYNISISNLALSLNVDDKYLRRVLWRHSKNAGLEKAVQRMFHLGGNCFDLEKRETRMVRRGDQLVLFCGGSKLSAEKVGVKKYRIELFEWNNYRWVSKNVFVEEANSVSELEPIMERIINGR